MRVSEYKRFKERVQNAKKEDSVWWAGYAWMTLSELQHEDIVKVLESKGELENVTDSFGRKAIRLPSGLEVAVR